MSSYTRQQLESWIKTITTRGRVLDIGGSQNPVLKRLDHTKIYHDEYKILDLENPHECKVKPDIVWDLNKPITEEYPLFWELNDINRIYKNAFDIAFCLEVSEYWWNPVQALRNINTLLKQEGELYISTHFVYPVHLPVEQDYFRYTNNGIMKLLWETGFETVEVIGRLAEDYELLRTWWDIEKMRPAKDYEEHHLVGALIKAIKL